MSNNITKKLYENIYRALGGDPNVQFETADDVWNAVTDIYDEGYDPIELSTLEMTITENGVHEVDAPNNDGYNKVKVEVAVESTGATLDFTQYGYSEADSAAATGFITDSINTLALYPTDGSSNWEIEKGQMMFGPKITVNFTDGFSTPDIFSNETNLIYVPAPEIINIASTGAMFMGCSVLKEVPLFDTSNVTNMSQMFMDCANLRSVPHYNTGNVQAMSDFLNGCGVITSVPQFDTHNVVYADNMFKNCISLTSIPELNFSNLQSMYNPLLYDDNHQWSGMGYPQLTDLGGFVGFGSNPDINYMYLAHCTALTYDSLMNVINKIADRATLGLSTGTLQLHYNAQYLLTDDDINIAVNKGWNVMFEA
jgi:surface protein